MREQFRITLYCQLLKNCISTSKERYQSLMQSRCSNYFISLYLIKFQTYFPIILMDFSNSLIEAFNLSFSKQKKGRNSLMSVKKFMSFNDFGCEKIVLCKQDRNCAKVGGKICFCHNSYKTSLTSFTSFVYINRHIFLFVKALSAVLQSFLRLSESSLKSLIKR